MTIRINQIRSSRMYTDLLRNELYVSVFCLFSSKLSHAQVTTYPIQGNAVLLNFHKANPAYQFQGNLKSKFGNRDTLELPFFDDFSYNSPIANINLWQKSSVFVNRTYPINPPTIGVVTLDGLDSNGLAYDINISNFSGFADKLTSHPIDLSNSTNPLFLMFYYQPQGLGDNPQTEDSLILEFSYDSLGT